MNFDQSIEKLNRIELDNSIQNLIAQANSRYILLNTSEDRNEFPAYTINDDSLNILAFYYLEIACSLAETQNLEPARLPFERGALLLENVHGSALNKTYMSGYYALIAAMAYYASFQYSKAFILVKQVSYNTVIASLVCNFLSRNYTSLDKEIEALSVDPQYYDSQLIEGNENSEGANRVYEIVIAKALNGFIRYFQTGNIELLNSAKERLALLKEIAEIQSEPAVWWIVRLLIIISDGFTEASLWNVLGKNFDLNQPVIKNYIRSLVYLYPKSVYELFITQRKSLPKVLNEDGLGCIVTIPTSSGKTRIAEIAIVKALVEKPECKVLYLAPFRSLAFEVEIALADVLGKIGFVVSQLYGGSLFSQLDQKVIDEANVIIATPEKAKAMLRSNPELSEDISLIIIDEGHLLGADKRLVVNEIFYEELRSSAEKNKCKFLVLSAVLPNPNELALWLAKSEDSVFKDSWRPSNERIGILDWTGNQVNLEWINNDTDRQSFNNKFVNAVALPLVGKQRIPRFHPQNKNDAVAATAFKLRNFGTVLIFVGVKASVFVMAESYLKNLSANAEEFNYKNKLDWKAYELACVETYGDDNKWLKFAKKGILCHHGSLHSDVRLPLERLMRSSPPLVIISTSTLGQGVNLGVSTVIFSTLYQAGGEITPRDFWNIAGRAGRAFVDHEGKILVAMDTSEESRIFNGILRFKNTSPAFYRRVRRERIEGETDRIMKYFDKENIDIAQSGILALIEQLKSIAENSDIDFGLFLQLISENNIDDIGEDANEIDQQLDWIDDTLLALHNSNTIAGEENNFAWIDNFFRKSLAYIQINAELNITHEEFTGFLTARIKGIIKKVGTDRDKWISIVKSGIPLNSDLLIEKKLKDVILLIQNFYETDQLIEHKVALISTIIKLVKDIPIVIEEGNSILSNDLDVVLYKWINAKPISELLIFNEAESIISDFFTFLFPWIFNGIAKKLRNMDHDNFAELIEEMSILLETGLPNLKSVKIYQAGIRSRISAFEISSYFEDELWDKGIQEYKMEILERHVEIKASVSNYCSDWIDMLQHSMNSKTKLIRRITNFTYDIDPQLTKTLVARRINGIQHLISPDLSVVNDISDTDIDFSEANDLQGVYFEYQEDEKVWRMTVDNPHIKIENER